MFDVVRVDRQLRLADADILWRIYRELQDLHTEYPQFSSWFWNVMRPGLLAGNRDVFCAYEGNVIAGVLILKNTEEKKICTLRVKSDFRMCGLGRLFVQQAKLSLGCENPFVTVPEKHFKEFHPLFSNEGFTLEARYPGYYVPESDEFAYNGIFKIKQKRRDLIYVN